MNTTRLLPWAAAPVGLFLLVDAWMGWLDPAYWLDQPAMSMAHTPLAKEGDVPSGRRRKETRPPPPWPDEPAMRVQLASRGLRLTGFQLGPQRMGATEVRVTLQWQGPLGASLEMWQALALDMPQMVLDAWVMQALPDHEWRVVWRGQWQKTAVPQPLPPRPPAIEGLTAYARTGFFDPLVLRRELARLWPQGQPSAALLRLVRPDDLRLEAVMHLPEPMAWLSWHQQALSVRVGDRIGEEGGRVQAIGNDHVVIVQGGRVWRVLATAVAVPEKETP